MKEEDAEYFVLVGYRLEVVLEEPDPVGDMGGMSVTFFLAIGQEEMVTSPPNVCFDGYFYLILSDNTRVPEEGAPRKTYLPFISR